MSNYEQIQADSPTLQTPEEGGATAVRPSLPPRGSFPSTEEMISVINQNADPATRERMERLRSSGVLDRRGLDGSTVLENLYLVASAERLAPQVTGGGYSVSDVKKTSISQLVGYLNDPHSFTQGERFACGPCATIAQMGFGQDPANATSFARKLLVDGVATYQGADGSSLTIRANEGFANYWQQASNGGLNSRVKGMDFTSTLLACSVHGSLEKGYCIASDRNLTDGSRGTYLEQLGRFTAAVTGRRVVASVIGGNDRAAVQGSLDQQLSQGSPCIVQLGWSQGGHGSHFVPVMSRTTMTVNGQNVEGYIVRNTQGATTGAVGSEIRDGGPTRYVAANGAEFIPASVLAQRIQGVAGVDRTTPARVNGGSFTFNGQPVRLDQTPNYDTSGTHQELQAEYLNAIPFQPTTTVRLSSPVTTPLPPTSVQETMERLHRAGGQVMPEAARRTLVASGEDMSTLERLRRSIEAASGSGTAHSHGDSVNGDLSSGLFSRRVERV